MAQAMMWLVHGADYERLKHEMTMRTGAMPAAVVAVLGRLSLFLQRTRDRCWETRETEMSKAADRLLRSARNARLAAEAGGSDGFFTVHVPDAVDVAAIRRASGLSQAAFAARYGFELGTLRNWEQEVRRPSGAARVLLTVIARQPEAVEATPRVA